MTLLSVELLIILVLFILSFFVFVFLARRIFWQKKDEFDFAVFDFMRPLISELRTDTMEFFTFVAQFKNGPVYLSQPPYVRCI